MEIIYWFQRLFAINILAWIVLVIGIIATIISLMAYSVNHEFVDTLDSSERACEMAKRWFRTAPWVIGISAMVCVFVPTEKQMYAIYGIGGTIDYIKSNETARQLPDKVVIALDKWVDSINEDKSTKDEQQD